MPSDAVSRAACDLSATARPTAATGGHVAAGPHPGRPARPVHADFIDGMRAIAVLSVIVYHMDRTVLPGGLFGVDVFFVISGFVVSISVSNLDSVPLPRLLGYFYARRLSRIVPALAACLLATFLLSIMLIPDAWLSRTNQRTGLDAFFGLSNFILAGSEGDYFSPTAEYNPFTHTWSLAVEEQFYLLFPFLILAWLHGWRRFSATVLGLGILVSLASAVWIGTHDRTAVFYMPWCRFWELGTGVFLFQLLAGRGHSFAAPAVPGPGEYRPRISADLCLALMAAGLALSWEGLPYLPGQAVAAAGAAGLLALQHGRRGNLAHLLLTLPPMRYLGRISYSLYLWHWPVFVLFRWTVGMESIPCLAAAAALTGLAAVASFHLIEQPARRSARLVPRPVAVLAGLAVIVVGYAGAQQMVWHKHRLALSTVMRNAHAWYPEMDAATFADGCRVASRQAAGNPAGISVLSRDGCRTGSASSGRDLYVLGDSHAGAYVRMLQHHVGNTGDTVHLYHNSGCPFMAFLGARNPRCDKAGQDAMADIGRRIKPGDVLFLPSLRLPRLVDQWGAVDGTGAGGLLQDENTARLRREEGARAAEQLREIAGRGAFIVFEGPTPVLRTIMFRCADWFDRANPICRQGDSVPRELVDRMRAPTLEIYRTLQRAVPRVSVWDPLPLLCSAGACSGLRDGQPLIFDGDHLSGYANEYLLPSFTAFISALEARDHS